MKRTRFLRAAAALLTIMILLCPLLAAGAENAAAGTEKATEETEKPTAAPTHTPSELQAMGILTVGAKGDEVTRLQQRLKDLGYLSGKVDGQYGGGTKRAVISFQRRNGLQTDGVAGETTLAKLYAEDAVAAPENSEERLRWRSCTRRTRSPHRKTANRSTCWPVTYRCW